MPNSTGIGNHVENKHEMVSHSFDIFSNMPIEKAMDRGYEQEILPATTLSNEGPFEFIIPPSSDYIFFPHTRLHIQGKIQTENNADPDAATEYSVVNLFPQSLFKNIEVHVGGINTAPSNGLYPYKAFFETLFSYSEVGKSSHVASCSGWIDDTPEQYDTKAAANAGYTSRKQFVSTGRTFDFCIPLHADIFQCSRLIPPKTPVKIILTRQPDVFSLMAAAGTQLKINLLKLSIFIRRIIPSEQISSLYLNQLEKKEVVLPFSRSIIKRETIPVGTTNINIPLFNGELPRQILIAFVASTRLDGRQAENPFYFYHNNVNYVNLRINGLSEPNKPYTPDFTNYKYTRELRALYDNTGVLSGDNGFCITRAQFRSGKTFFAWDLTPDHCNGFHIHDKKIGKTVDLDLGFSAALEAAINVLVYATYESEIKILDGQTIEAKFVNG